MSKNIRLFSIYKENLIQYWGKKSALETAVEERELEIAKNLIVLGLDNATIAQSNRFNYRANAAISRYKRLKNRGFDTIKSPLEI